MRVESLDQVEPLLQDSDLAELRVISLVRFGVSNSEGVERICAFLFFQRSQGSEAISGRDVLLVAQQVRRGGRMLDVTRQPISISKSHFFVWAEKPTLNCAWTWRRSARTTGATSGRRWSWRENIQKKSSCCATKIWPQSRLSLNTPNFFSSCSSSSHSWQAFGRGEESLLLPGPARGGLDH